MLSVFRGRKMLVLLVLGFSSGLPLYMTNRMFQAWLTVVGVDLTSIGFLGLAGLPYSLKFLWAPAVDRFVLSAKIGRRRSWLLVTQAMLTVVGIAIAASNPASGLGLAVALVFVLAVLSATQDIAVDAYRVDVSTKTDASATVSVEALGYRLALLVTGGAAFVIAGQAGWPAAYVAVSILIGVAGIAGTGLARETDRAPSRLSLSQAVREPFADFLRRLGRRQAIEILAFVLLYRITDSMVDLMSTPFLVQAGYDLAQIGTIRGGIGLVATVGGTLLGGWAAARWGVVACLWTFGVMQGASNVAYWVLTQTPPRSSVLVAVIATENVCYGLATVAFVGYLTSLCNAEFSATQYAVLSSLAAVGRDVIASPSGWLAEKLGWPGFFLLSAVAVLPGLVLLARVSRVGVTLAAEERV